MFNNSSIFKLTFNSFRILIRCLFIDAWDLCIVLLQCIAEKLPTNLHIHGPNVWILFSDLPEMPSFRSVFQWTMKTLVFLFVPVMTLNKTISTTWSEIYSPFCWQTFWLIEIQFLSSSFRYHRRKRLRQIVQYIVWKRGPPSGYRKTSIWHVRSDATYRQSRRPAVRDNLHKDVGFSASYVWCKDAVCAYHFRQIGSRGPKGYLSKFS